MPDMPEFIAHTEKQASKLYGKSIIPNEVTYALDPNNGEEFIIFTFKNKRNKPVKARLDVIMALISHVNHELLGSHCECCLCKKSGE